MEKFFFPELIETQDLVLKKHELSLAKIMFESIDRDRVRLREFLPWVDVTTKPEDTENFIKSAIQDWENFEMFDYGLFEKASNLYLGNLGVHSISWHHHHCELGYWIAKNFEGKGYISAAITAIESICFSLGFHRIEIRCSSHNLKSASVPKRLGYEYEGNLRQSKFERGEFVDTLVFAKLAKD